jgi:hypothetical protein
MAWRIHDHVLRGEIDNRTRGQVTGRIWLAGVAEPMVLELTGDCHPDLAGCTLAFSNPNPVPMTTKPPALQQRGTAGDITAARKVKVPDVPIEEFVRMKNGPWHWANSLYLEWFSERAGRVVIESADYKLKVSEPAWRFTAEELAAREREREEGTGAFATEVRRDGEEGDWDEFRHEQLLRESDALTEKYGRLLEKYQDHPDSEEIIAREMGWTKMEDELAAGHPAEEGAEVEDDEDDEDEEDDEIARMNAICEEALDAESPEPDPEREGIDWVRDERGDIVHPIEQRAGRALRALLAEMKADPVLDQSEDEDFGEFVGNFMTMRAKLAGALGAIAKDRGYRPEPGFTIALLKRILEIHNKTLAAADALAGKTLLPAGRLAHYRTELFGVREEILALIALLRG